MRPGQAVIAPLHDDPALAHDPEALGRTGIDDVVEPVHGMGILTGPGQTVRGTRQDRTTEADGHAKPVRTAIHIVDHNAGGQRRGADPAVSGGLRGTGKAQQQQPRPTQEMAENAI